MQCQPGTCQAAVVRQKAVIRFGTIPTFYPMCFPQSGGDADMPRRRKALGVVIFQSGCGGRRPPNPVRGGPESPTPFNPAGVGSFAPGDRPNRNHHSGDRTQTVRR